MAIPLRAIHARSAGSVWMHTTAKPPPSKPAGAYRPPGARGLAAPPIFKREDEGGVLHSASNGSFTPPRGYSRGPVPGAYANVHSHSEQNGRAGGGRGGRRVHVHGAPAPSVPGGGSRRGR